MEVNDKTMVKAYRNGIRHSEDLKDKLVTEGYEPTDDKFKEILKEYPNEFIKKCFFLGIKDTLAYIQVYEDREAQQKCRQLASNELYDVFRNNLNV